MILTEAEALTKWCPFVRIYAYTGTSPVRETAPRVIAPTSAGGPANRWIDADGVTANPDACRCLASDCMVWMWMTEEGAGGARHGYCGLAMGSRMGHM